MAHEIMPALIEGLPDAVALTCLARVPFSYHQNLRLVCRSWRAALCGPEIFEARRKAGVSEELLCILTDDSETVWMLCDPCRDHWLTLAFMPFQLRSLYSYGVASVSGKLFVLGGRNDHFRPHSGDHDDVILAISEVWSYDPFSREWSQRANMLVPRFRFACCSIDGKIVVAGGYMSFNKTISKAEIYDPDTNTWRSLPDLPQTHPSNCSGVVIGGKIHVFHEGHSAVQILEDGQQWSVEDLGWHRGLMADIREELYVLNFGGFILNGSQRSNTLFRRLVPYGPLVKCPNIFADDDLFVFGLGPMNQWNKQLRDVDVLSLNINSPTWRAVSTMPGCGSIFGCYWLKV